MWEIVWLRLIAWFFKASIPCQKYCVGMNMTLSVPVKIESLIKIAQWVDACSESLSISASKVFAVQLCCEEAFSNIVKYGVSTVAGSAEESACALFSLDHKEDQLDLLIEAPGVAFNPLDAERPAAPKNISEAKVGGLGIELMKKFSQKISYERKNSKNNLLFVFDLSGAA